MRKNFSRIITAVLSFAMMIGMSTTAMAASGTEQVSALLSREIIVTYDGELQTFTNANGVQVRPIAYQGTTYLPVRATAKMFNNDIQWLGEQNTVAINEGVYSGDNFTDIEKDNKTKNETIEVTVNYDLIVTYKDEVQSFFDVNGMQVFPITKDGTTYLPIRAITNMFNEKIEWVGSENRVAIGEGVYTPEKPTEGEDIPDSDYKKVFHDYYTTDKEFSVTFSDTNEGYEMFTGEIMKVETTRENAEDANPGSIKFFYKEDLDLGHVFFTIHNAGSTAITLLVNSSDKYEVIVIQPGVTLERDTIVGSSKWVTFDIAPAWGTNTCIIIGNMR